MERNPNLTAAYLQGAVEKAVKQAARDTVMLNARREKNARWARIPAGDACGFCEMCGSRGFVYASEESAAGEWHPFCNCQVAIAFDPIEGEGGEVSQELRDYDPEALYEDYKARLAKYKKGARYRDYTSPVRLKAESFEAAMRELSEARTLDELHEVGDRIARKWHKNGRRPDPEQWREMSRHAQELERGFLNAGDGGRQAVREAMVDSKWYEDAQTRSVHWDAVDSKDYTAKLAEIVGDKDMARMVHEDVKAILKKTDKTPFEELYAYDLTAKERIERIIDQRKPLEVVPTEKFKERVKERIDAGHRVATLHNHSGNSIPSLADIHGLRTRGDEFGIVACHNGEIFTYKVIGEPAEGYIIDSSKEAREKFIGSFRDRFIKKGFDAALSDLGELYGVKFERFL